MTTKPKARKFRIRRTPASQAGPVSDTAQTPAEEPQQPGPRAAAPATVSGVQGSHFPLKLS